MRGIIDNVKASGVGLPILSGWYTAHLEPHTANTTPTTIESFITIGGSKEGWFGLFILIIEICLITRNINLCYFGQHDFNFDMKQ